MQRKTAISVGLLFATLVGCGEGISSISGEVTYNGVPVERGYMTFNPVGKGRPFAAPITDGRYSIPKAESGTFTALATGSRKLNHYSSSAEANANAQKNNAHFGEVGDYIAPEAEGNRKQVDIASGDQQLDFAITGPPMPK